MPAADLRRRWRNGDITYAAAVRLGHTWITEILASSGLDVVWIDQQHGFIPDDLLLPMLQSMNGTGTTSLVRVPVNDPPVIGRVLDAGAEGIIVPMVQTADDARRAIAGCSFGPDGTRSHGALRLRYLPGGIRREVICLVMIETEVAVRNVGDILDVPGIDGVFIGPSDLALSFGLAPGSTQAGPVADAIARILGACREHGAVAAITGDPRQLKQQGFQMISLGSDDVFLDSGLRDVLRHRDETA
jgi:4-hydroxy-2-oxoheptanedioate aldolase